MTFAEELAGVPFTERDAWVDARLGISPPPPDVALPAGAVPYLPCGVEEILVALDALEPGPADVFVDLGSGLGRVVLLAHLLTGARAHGIEVQEHLVASSRRCATELGVAGAVTFTQANAADVELDGSCFFLYAPCNGDLLARVTQRLDTLARRKAIAVCAVNVELTGCEVLKGRPARNPAVVVYG